MVGSHSLNWPQVWKPHEYWDCRNISPHPVLDKFLGLQRNESLSIRQNGLVVLFPFYSDLYFKSLHLMHFEYRSKLFFIHKRLILKICARGQKGHFFMCVHLDKESSESQTRTSSALKAYLWLMYSHTYMYAYTHTTHCIASFFPFYPPTSYKKHCFVYSLIYTPNSLISVRPGSTYLQFST